MKKTMMLFAVMCLASIGFAQVFDFDRVLKKEVTEPVWFTSFLNNAQLVDLPSYATYKRIVVFEPEVQVDGVVLQFKPTKKTTPTKLNVLLDGPRGIHIEYWAQHPVQFVLIPNGETLVQDGNGREYTLSYLVQMRWNEPKEQVRYVKGKKEVTYVAGPEHKKYIAKVY